MDGDHHMMELLDEGLSGDGWEEEGADNWMKLIELTNE